MLLGRKPRPERNPLKTTTANPYMESAALLTNGELLELYEVFLDKVEGRKGIHHPELWEHHTQGLAALEVEMDKRRGS